MHALINTQQHIWGGPSTDLWNCVQLSSGYCSKKSSHLGLPRLQFYLLNSRLPVSRFPFPNPQPEILPQAVTWGNYRIYSFISTSRITVLCCLISKVLRGILSGFLFVCLFFKEFQARGSIEFLLLHIGQKWQSGLWVILLSALVEAMPEWKMQGIKRFISS